MGVKNIALNCFFHSISSIATEKKIIALTFDDRPSTHTHEILDILKRYDVKATFFCIEEKAAKPVSLIQRMHTQGHIIGNHCYHHNFWFDFYTEKCHALALLNTNRIIQKIIAYRVNFFRPPYGITNPALHRAINKTGLVSIAWSVRSGTHSAPSLCKSCRFFIGFFKSRSG